MRPASLRLQTRSNLKGVRPGTDDELMPIRTGRDLHARSEGGFSLVELIVAAAILIIAVLGIFTALESVGRAGADERARAVAYQLAQEDQSRMRAMKATALLGPNQNGFAQTRTTTVDDTEFTIRSTSRITADATGTESCAADSASADYLSINSTVTWPTMDVKPVTIQSIITPNSGSFDPDTGALAISVLNGQGEGIPGVPVSGSGPGSFSGVTGETGCIIFANLPRGSYTVTPTASGLVDQDGDAAGPKPASVLAGATNTLVLQLDQPGEIEVNFKTRVPGTTTPQPSTVDTVRAFNTGMTTGETFGTLNDRVASMTLGPLFPFGSFDSVYAGTCDENVPDPTSPHSAIADVQVSPGTRAGPVTITVPAMDITVRTGTSSTNQGSLMSGAKVVITDRDCPNTKRTTFTNSSGKLPDPGLPWSSYDLCVSGRVGFSNRMVTRTNITVKNPNTPTVVPTVYLGGGSSTDSTGCR